MARSRASSDGQGLTIFRECCASRRAVEMQLKIRSRRPLEINWKMPLNEIHNDF